MPHIDPTPAASPDPEAAAAAAEAAIRIEAALTGPGAPFAVVRVEDGVHAGSLVYADGPRTLREFVETTWAFGDQPFLVSAERGYSYAEFFAAASALACRMTEVYGLRPGTGPSSRCGTTPSGRSPSGPPSW